MLLICFIMDSSNFLHFLWVESNLGQRLLNYFQHRVGALRMFQHIVNAPHIMCSSESLMNGFPCGSQSRVAVWWYSMGTRYVAFPHLNISENWKPNYKTFPISSKSSYWANLKKMRSVLLPCPFLSWLLKTTPFITCIIQWKEIVTLNYKVVSHF